MKIRALLFISLIALTSSVLAASAKLVSVRAIEDDNYHIVLSLSAPVSIETSSLHNPERWVLDLKNTQNATKRSLIKMTDNYVGAIRLSPKGKNLRIVFDLKNPTTVNVRKATVRIKNGHRLILDFKPQTKIQAVKPHAVPVATPQPPVLPKPEKKLPPPVKSTEQTLRPVIVLIDPGHGGRDPGASGGMGTKEKNVTLGIGLALRNDLEKVPGIKVYMTRTGDTYPTLGQRLAIARRVKADLFISIHADAYRNRSARGVTIFALSHGRATSEAARWIAERENRSELLGGVDLSDKSSMLRSVLVDLSQTATISLSLKLGSEVLHNISQFADMHSSKVEQASLYVLTAPDIPAILVETGFISNPYEERLLRDKIYQEKLADAIARGIQRYLIENPIQDTLFNQPNHDK